MRSILATAASLLLLSPAVDGPRFAPEKGSSLRRTFTESTSWDMESVKQRLNGQEAELPTLDAEMRIERELVVLDTFRELGDGRPKVLARELESLELHADLAIEAMGNTEGCEVSYTSPLAGATFVFTWDADQETYRCAPDEDEELDPALLEGLREDLDLRALLPAADAEEGASWTLSAEALSDLLGPGGAWPLAFDEAEGHGQVVPLEDAGLAAGVLLAIAAGQVEGELELTYGGELEVDGRKLAVIGLELEAECRGDSGHLYQQLLDSMGVSREVDSVTGTWEVQGEGSLTWDLTAGHFHSLDLSLGTEIIMLATFQQDGAQIELEGTLAGETKLAARCASAESR